MTQVSTAVVEYPSGPFPQNLSWDEFLALPDELRNASLVDGEVIVNPPNAQHELVVYNLRSAFTAWTRAGSDRGQSSTQQPVKIGDQRGYQPDVSWFPEEHCTPDGQDLRFTGLPGIVVEILSPSTRAFDFIRKRHDYEVVGIPEVWFIEPSFDRYSVIVCQRPKDEGPFVDVELSIDDHITSPLLDGFDLPVADLFRR
jgi:Uma2 family endonuclease